MSQNIELLITTAERTWNPAEAILVNIAGTVEPSIQYIPETLLSREKRPWREATTPI
jgi:hypothetical protein